MNRSIARENPNRQDHPGLENHGATKTRLLQATVHHEVWEGDLPGDESLIELLCDPRGKRAGDLRVNQGGISVNHDGSGSLCVVL